MQIQASPKRRPDCTNRSDVTSSRWHPNCVLTGPCALPTSASSPPCMPEGHCEYSLARSAKSAPSPSIFLKCKEFSRTSGAGTAARRTSNRRAPGRKTPFHPLRWAGLPLGAQYFARRPGHVSRPSPVRGRTDERRVSSACVISAPCGVRQVLSVWQLPARSLMRVPGVGVESRLGKPRGILRREGMGDKQRTYLIRCPFPVRGVRHIYIKVTTGQAALSILTCLPRRRKQVARWTPPKWSIPEGTSLEPGTPLKERRLVLRKITRSIGLSTSLTAVEHPSRGSLMRNPPLLPIILLLFAGTGALAADSSAGSDPDPGWNDWALYGCVSPPSSPSSCKLGSGWAKQDRSESV